MVGNYYKPGPATDPGQVSHRIANPSWSDGIHGLWYIADNYMEGDEAVTDNNWLGVHPNSKEEGVLEALRRDTPWPSMPINEQCAQEAYRLVLDQAGAILPRRDAVDSRIVSDVQNGTAACEGPTYNQRKPVRNPEEKSGIIDTPSDAGGWPELHTLPAPADTDHDGMTDDYEKAHGLDPNDSDDGSRLSDSGYTHLEEYLNSLDNWAK